MILGVGTRWSDFTTASRSIFATTTCASSTSTSRRSTPSSTPGCRSSPTRGSAWRRSTEALDVTLRDARPTTGTRSSSAPTRSGTRPLPVPGRGHRRRQPRQRPARRRRLRRGLACPATCTSSGARATRRATTSSTATRRWATRSPAASGVKMAAPDREVFVLVGDGSYLMMAQELVTAVAEGIKLTIVLVQNHGYQSIGALSRVRRLPALRHRSTATVERTRSCRSTWPPTPPASAPARSTPTRSRSSRRAARGGRRPT